MVLFEEYKNHPDPIVRERASNWAVAIGLQRVDGLNVSEFLIRVAHQSFCFPHSFYKRYIRSVYTLGLANYAMVNTNCNSPPGWRSFWFYQFCTGAELQRIENQYATIMHQLLKQARFSNCIFLAQNRH